MSLLKLHSAIASFKSASILFLSETKRNLSSLPVLFLNAENAFIILAAFFALVQRPYIQQIYFRKYIFYGLFFETSSKGW
ncbi:MAG: hypothetical protein R2847_06605 [Bacteroidia bacterium]